MSRKRRSAIWRYGLTLAAIGTVFLVSGSAGMLALGLALVIPVPVSLAVCAYVRKDIRCRLQLPTTASKGQPWGGSLILENSAVLPAGKLEILLRMVNDLTGEENQLEFSGALGPGEQGQWDFQMESRHCGRVYMEVKSARIMDVFGIFSLNVPVKAGARVTILPDLYPCDAAVNEAFSRSDEGTASRKGEDRTEVFQLREYRYGDDIRQIHWKLSAKTDEMILREGSSPIDRELLVFWDKGKESTPAGMDAMAEVTASVCQALCEGGSRFNLAWTEAEEARIRQIGSMEQLLQAIPELVSCGRTQVGRGPDMTGYSRCIRVSQSEEAGGDLELVSMDPTGEIWVKILFSPDNYKKKLERLEL